MNKKILSTLLIASMAITGLFAYSTPTAIINADMNETSYEFSIKYGASAYGDDATATDYNMTLSPTTSAITNSDFTVLSNNIGNLEESISFTATVRTGEFKSNSEFADAHTSLYPIIIGNPTHGGTASLPTGDSLSYASDDDGVYTATNSGVFTRIITPGRHEIGTELARFKLGYKGNDLITAGSYVSTSTIDIATI
jgi:hypothetical protein